MGNNNNNINNFLSTIKIVDPVFPYYILFESEMREPSQLIFQILVEIIDVLEVLLCLI